MANIYMPTPPPKVDKGSSGGSKNGALLGALAGAALAASSGGVAMIGAAGAGSSLGGLLGNAASPARQGSVTQPDVPPPVQAPDSGGVAKRMADIENSNLFNLQQAKAALQGMHQDLRKHYEPYIDEAMRAAMVQQKMGVA
jgi:phage tail tape-measure protein